MASKSKKPEAVAAKSVDVFNKEMAELQTKARSAISDVGEALVSKKEELDVLVEEIAAKKAELTDLIGKEAVEQDLEQLRERLADAEHQHERKLAQLNIENEDKLKAAQRAHADWLRQKNQAQQDEARTRKQVLEDEDRERQMAFTARTSDLADQVELLAKKETELGSFDDKLKGAVAKAAAAIKRDFEFKTQTVTTEHTAKVVVLESKIDQAEKANQDLTARLRIAEETVTASLDKTQRIAEASLEAAGNKIALAELKALTTQQAAGAGKR